VTGVPRERRWRDPEPYQKYRAPLQQRWRPLILARDKHRCRNCKAMGNAAGKGAARAVGKGAGKPAGAAVQLDVAHITDAVAFVRAAGDHRGVTFSYRWDNLYTLCHDCHKASHRFRLSAADQEVRWQVQQLEESLRRLRGWASPYAVLPPHMVPERLRPRRSFHDVIRLSPLVPFPTFARYAADGGLVFADQESAPPQAALDGPPPRAATSNLALGSFSDAL